MTEHLAKNRDLAGTYSPEWDVTRNYHGGYLTVSAWRPSWTKTVTGQQKQVIPSGKHTKNHGKSPSLMGKSTISMAIFNSKLLNYQRVQPTNSWIWNVLDSFCKRVQLEPWFCSESLKMKPLDNDWRLTSIVNNQGFVISAYVEYLFCWGLVCMIQPSQTWPLNLWICRLYHNCQDCKNCKQPRNNANNIP